MLLTLIMAIQISEMLVNLYQSAWHYNPEDSHIHTHCCENLKSYLTSTELLATFCKFLAAASNKYNVESIPKSGRA
jgi:hypothetical protein